MTDNLLLEQLERQLEVASLSGEVQAVMHGIVEYLMRLEGADGASLSAVENGYAYFKVSLGADTPLQGRIIPLGETLGGRTVQTGELAVLRAGEGSTLDESLTAGAGVIVLVPVFYDGATRGILGVRSHRPDAFTENDILTADMLARSAAIALRNAELVERVERSEREYRRLHDQAADAILVTDAEGHLLDANEEAAALLGYSVGELRSMHAADLATAAEAAEWLDVVQTRGIVRDERPLKRKDGTAVLIEYSTRTLDDGRTHTTLRDVTERRAHQTRLESNLERTRAIIETQRAISALELDPDAVTAAIVERAQRLTGADGATVAVVDGHELVWQYASGMCAGHEGLKHSIADSLGGLVVTQGRTLHTADASIDKRAHRPTAEIARTRSLISAPLEREGRVVGVLSVVSSDPNAFDELAVETTTVMAQFVSGVMRNAEELATRNQLVERLRLQSEVVEHMQTALWIFAQQPDGRLVIEYANEASFQATGLVRDDVIGRSAAEVLPASADDIDKSLNHVIATGERLDLGELEYGDSRIRRGVFHVKAYPLGDGRVAAAFDNVTERVYARRALQESEERFRGAFYTASVAIALSALDGHFVQANERLSEMLGYSSGELMRSHWGMLLADDDEIAHLRTLTGELLEGKRDFYIGEARMRRKDGREVWVRLGVSLIRDYEGNPVHFVAHVEDVSERHALELQLRQAQKMEAVGRLAGGIAHDFNNLLTAISGYTEFLIGSIEDERQRRHAEEIKRAAQRAASLTGQLLAFSRRQVLQPRVVNLNAIVTDMDMMLRRLIGEDVELVFHADQSLGAVRADPTQIEQVIINLVVNARDAMPSGGSLTIETMNVAEGDAELVVMRLTDTGIGMTEDQRQRLFDPFFTTKEGGTGLGLATVYGIVEQSGGTIVVDSEPGIGTSFRITLPRVANEAEAPAPPLPVTPPRVGTETILLVEDEAVVRRLVAEILETSGYTVLQAGDGPSALELLRRNNRPVELLLTDVVMPGMSGREVAQAVTSMRPGTQVLYMSGYTGSVIDHHGILEQGVAFLQKPFTADDLTRSIRILLDGPD
ncbi:MAG TPA: PAS domain S-box protein [Gaiellaceae bacterium]|nr:PAS domain S-box protein [Gaiellaceae bacterium]